MTMTAAKAGSRKTIKRITISAKTKIIGFSASFLRSNGLTMENTHYARFGYDPDIRCIGVDLLPENNGQGECLKLTWSKNGSNASFQKAVIQS